MPIDEKVQDVATKIGEFYYSKNNCDCKATETEILSLLISEISIRDDGVIIIKLARPGLLIGRKGENVIALAKFLEAKIDVVEDVNHVYNYLMAYGDFLLPEE